MNSPGILDIPVIAECSSEWTTCLLLECVIRNCFVHGVISHIRRITFLEGNMKCAWLIGFPMIHLVGFEKHRRDMPTSPAPHYPCETY